jgi:transposase
VRRFDIAVGHCCDCHRRVQGRHPLQTSNAVGVGNVQLGPEALTLAAILNKQMGLSSGIRVRSFPTVLGWRSAAEDCTGRWRGWLVGRRPPMRD